MTNRLLALIILAGLLLVPVIVAATDHAPTPTPIPEATVEATPEATAEITPEATAEATAAVALVGDAARGDELFHHGLNGAPACSNCHSTTTSGKGGPLAIGPGLLGISERAATRVEGMSAAEYVEDSIRHPSDYVVAGFSNVMYKDFARDYSDQDIADLVAYVLTH